MRKSFWDKRIPTLLGIFLITISVGVTTFLVNQEAILQINAAPSEQPQNVRITNVTDASFSVSYSTNNSVIGSINYGKSLELGQSGLDDRDQQSGSLTNYKIHSITVRNLSPLTKYYFTITSGQDSYMNNNQPFEVTTGPPLTNSDLSENIANGKIVLPNGESPEEAIVYLTTGNSQVISALAKKDGSYSLSLSTLRTGNLSSFYTFTKDSSITMLIFGDSLTSNVSASSEQADSVPTITLSKDYDFRINNSPIATESANLVTFPSFESSSSSAKNSTNSPQILTPKEDQEFVDQQPLFKGTAVPGEDVQIIIHSDENINTEVSADQNGSWSFKPSTQLSPGEHTITIITRDANGILKSITQSFVVHAAENEISESTTPSVTPTPGSFSQGGLNFTSSITATLTPTITSPEQPLPPTGNNSIIAGGIIGIFIMAIGSLLFLLARKGFSIL